MDLQQSEKVVTKETVVDVEGEVGAALLVVGVGEVIDADTPLAAAVVVEDDE